MVNNIWLGIYLRKKVDEDMCFMRDIVSVAGAISDITGVQPMKEVVQTFLINNGLWDKFTEFERIQSSSIIKDCYPLDRMQKYANAEKLLSLVNKFNFSNDERNHVLYHILKIISQMDFDKEEKEKLIKNYILKNKIDDKELENFVIAEYMELFNNLSH